METSKPPHEVLTVPKITESTLVPIGLVIVFLGGVAWITDIKVTTDQNKEILTRIEKEYVRVIRDIDERLSRIEGKLDMYKGKKQ